MMLTTLNRRILKRTILCFGIAGLPLGILLNYQILPDAPIEGVRVTMFSDDGFRLWNLKGSSAAYGEAGEVSVTDLDLTIYQGDQGKVVDMHILGKRAVYESEDRSVFGDGGVFVDGDFYKIEGESWDYSQNDRVVNVRENVKVVIEYQLESFLK